jgi:hypothetical protein
MPDYEPVAIGGLCNAGPSLLGDEPVETGPQSFLGLPFLIGGSGAGENCFVEVSGSSGAVTVPIGAAARGLVFVHRLLKSEVSRGGPLGIDVAEYVFRYDDGSEERARIRERFEIGSIPGKDDIPGVPGTPFLAVPDLGPELYARYEGPWEEAGRRQTEAGNVAVKQYYLWSWDNPHPDRAIAAVELVPKGPPFMVAAITLRHVDERPFTREARRPMKVVLKDAERAGRPFDVDVKVDRGSATFTHPLPEKDAAGFLGDKFKGWGEEQSAGSGSSYVEVSAVPSATVTVEQGGEEVGSARWGEVAESGSVETPAVRFELIDPGKNWVNVTVLDDDTGRPVPCRVHFRSPDGVPYQPHGFHNQVNSNLNTWHIDVGGDVRLGQITYACIDGACEGWLPRGEVIVDVARGFEYEPLRKTVSIEPGQRELTLRIKRWSHLNAEGWYSGDSHVHFLSAQGSHTESQGEDLNVVNLLQSQWGSLFTNTEEFTGGASVHQQGSNIVYVSQENRQHFLGHLILWGLKEPVMPWCSDGPGEAEPGGSLDVTMSDWADQTHAQGGHVIIPHLPNPNGEPAALIATGRADGVEMLRKGEFNHLEYYRYLNCGYRLPLVGGTDKMSSDVPIGLYRTYARVGDQQEFTYRAWCDTVKQGRTFLSGGPLIGLTVDGADIGDTLRLSASGSVEVHAWAESILPIHTLQIVQEGRVVAQADAAATGAGRRRLELREKVKVDGHSWLAARVGGPGYGQVDHHDGWQRGIFAHTSPVYVAVGGDWWMFDRDAAEYMLTLIDGCLTYVRHTAPLRPDAETTFHHGEADHVAYLERPFHEAREAIHRRMHQLGIAH